MKRNEEKDKDESEKKNINHNKEKGTIDIQPISNIYNKDKNYNDKGNLDNNLKIITDESIIFKGKEFKNYNRVNMYNTKRKIKKIIDKCINMRKDEKLRNQTGQEKFCTATLEYIYPGQNKKSGYFLKKEHSTECEMLTEEKVKKLDLEKKPNNKEILY